MIPLLGKSHKIRQARAALMRWAVSILMIVPLSACKNKQQVQSPPPPVVTPSYQMLTEIQNSRVEKLQQFYGQGVIEIRWRDRKGNHFEQGNMEMWLDLPRKTALRVEKLGEVLLWLGSNEQQYWLFDLTGDEKTLRVGQHDQAQFAELGAIDVKPLTLLDLIGLTRLPTEGEFPEVQYSSEFDAWMIESTGTGGNPVRLFFDRTSLLPKRVESLDSGGEIVLYSSLKRYESVPRRNAPPVSLPKFPRLIDIFTTDKKTDEAQADMRLKAGQVKIAIDSLSGDPEPEQLARVFDLPRLIKALQPRQIEGEIAPTTAPN